MCNIVVKNMLEKPRATLGVGGITIGVIIERMFVRKVVCKGICVSILIAWHTMVSSKTSQ